MPGLPEILKALIAIVVLINPLEGVPIYLSRAAKLSDAERLKVARKASITVLILLLAAMAGGQGGVVSLCIQIASFTLAGGLIILLIALNMVLSSPKDDPASGGSGDFFHRAVGHAAAGGAGADQQRDYFFQPGNRRARRALDERRGAARDHHRGVGDHVPVPARGDSGRQAARHDGYQCDDAAGASSSPPSRCR